jgi:hypothetical protein
MYICFSLENQTFMKIQNYFQFRSAEYQRGNNHFNKFNKKQINYLTINSNQLNIRNEINIQEYSRHRDATYQTSTKVCILKIFIFSKIIYLRYLWFITIFTLHVIYNYQIKIRMNIQDIENLELV